MKNNAIPFGIEFALVPGMSRLNTQSPMLLAKMLLADAAVAVTATPAAAQVYKRTTADGTV